MTEQYWTRKYNLWRKMGSIVGHNMSECTVSARSYKVDLMIMKDKSALTPLDHVLVLNLSLSLLPILITVSPHFRCRQKKQEELKILRDENPALKEENARLRKAVDTQKEKKKPNGSDSAATMIGTIEISEVIFDLYHPH